MRTSVRPVDPPLPVTVVTAALSRLVDRHEVLRTTFTLGEDGMPVQVVHPAAGFPVPFSVRAAPASDAPPLGGALTRAPLWHMELTARDGLVSALRVWYKHLVTDGAGLDEWYRQLFMVCRGEELPASVTQPLDRAAGKASGTPAAARGNTDPALGVPQSLVPAGRGAGRELTTTVALPGAEEQVDEVCRAAGVARPAVLKSVLGWFFCRYTGQDRVLFADVLAPRRAGDHGIDCVTTVAPVLFVLDEEAGFDEMCRRVQDAALRVLWDLRAGGAPARELRAQTVARRRVGGFSPVYFNFPRRSPLTGPGAGPKESTRSRVRVHTERTNILDDPLSPVCEVHFVGPELILRVTADTSVLPEDTAGRVGAAVLHLLDTMTAAPTAPVRTAALPFPALVFPSSGVRLAGASWVDQRSLSEAVASAPGAAASEVELRAGTVTARVRLRPGATVFDVHEHVLARLHERRDIVAPDCWFPLPEGPDDDGHDRPGWVARTPRDGWTPDAHRPVLAPVTPAEIALAEAVRVTHGHPVTDMALTYTEAGGTQLRAPAVAEELRARGWVGLRHAHVASPCTLRTVARDLAAATGRPPQAPSSHHSRRPARM